MAFLVLVIDSTNDSIAQLNAKLRADSTKALEGVGACRDYLEAILNGSVDCSVQATTRDTDPSVATSGSGSAQTSFNLK